jgi:hypothetical protein
LESLLGRALEAGEEIASWLIVLMRLSKVLVVIDLPTASTTRWMIW